MVHPPKQACGMEREFETLYSSLPTGYYRIGKEIMDFRAGGDYDKYNCYAEFTVE